MKKERLMDGVGGRGIADCMVAPGKGKAIGLEEERDAGMDDLLAAVGYKVRFSDMADVAQKLEQLDMAIGCSSAAQDDALLTHLASDTIHYNPSDLSTWLESMLSELSAPPPARPANPGSDLRMENGSRNRKRMRSASSSSSSFRPRQLQQSASEAPSAEASVMLLDAQEIGIRLVHALLACAEAVQQENLKAADLLVKQISILASSQGGAMRKVAGYFAEALACKIYRFQPQQDSALTDLLQMHFYESCPYLKFAHFTANQAILEAFAGFSRVHVVDFGLMQGMQWPALMQALSLRPGGPPSFRLTGISPRHSADEQVGWKLAQFADAINVGFEYRGIVACSLADVEAFMLETAEAEALAVNSVFELHPLLARPGMLEKLLSVVRAARPRIVTMVEQEANHNAAGSFVGRFTEALHYYSTMFDSMEGGGGEGQQDRVMSEIYLGRQICNVVACEGPERTERHETLARWRARMTSAGFEAVHLGSNAFKQASMLLALFAGGDGYQVEETEGCLTLGWHTRPLIATSAWRVADSR